MHESQTAPHDPYRKLATAIPAQAVRDYTAPFPKNTGHASVIRGAGAYGSDIAPYELAVLHHDRLCRYTSITNNVIGYQTEQDIENLLERIEALRT
jgi:hypothetical protein